MSDESLRQALWEEANRILIDVTYSGREHQLVGNQWDRINRWLGVPSTVAGALLAGGAGVAALVGSDSSVTAALALTSAVLGGARSFLKPAETAEAHGLKGNRLISLRNDAQRFQQVDLRSSLPDDDLRARCEQLAERRNMLRESPPHHLPRWAYDKAKAGILEGESEYVNDPLWQGYPAEAPGDAASSRQPKV